MKDPQPECWQCAYMAHLHHTRSPDDLALCTRDRVYGTPENLVLWKSAERHPNTPACMRRDRWEPASLETIVHRVGFMVRK